MAGREPIPARGVKMERKTEQVRTCATCKHYDTSLAESPCAECNLFALAGQPYLNMWAPQPEDQRAKLVAELTE